MNIKINTKNLSYVIDHCKIPTIWHYFYEQVKKNIKKKKTKTNSKPGVNE